MEADQKAEMAKAFRQLADVLRGSTAQPKVKQSQKPGATVSRAA